MKWTAEAITELGTSYWRSCVVTAAVELGLFDAIGSGHKINDICAKIGSTPRHTEELLDALVGLELLVKRGDVYEFEESSAQYLDKTSPNCVLDALRFNTDLYQLWGRLAACVRSGNPVLSPTAHLGDDPDRTRRFVLGMHSRAMMMAPPLLSALKFKDEVKRMLDVGSGPGTFSRLLMEEHKDLSVAMFDLKPVLDVAMELTNKSGLQSRVTYHPGDYRTDALPKGFDAVFYCGALHQETPETAFLLFRKIAESLNKGGEVIVVDMMVEPDRTSPLFSILFSINMMLMSSIGRVFSDDLLQRILKEAAFKNMKTTKAKGSPYWIVRATKG
jgi:SAM-dependent methyltransferase